MPDVFDDPPVLRTGRLVMRAGNTASAALLRRAGFRQEGVLRERALKRGIFRDVQMFGITVADWDTATRPGPAE